MKDERKTKKQLIEELGELRKQIVILKSRSRIREPALNVPLKSAKRYLNLIDTIQEGLAIVDEEENIVFVNKPFRDILDYPEETLIGMNLLELLPDEEKYKVLDATKRKKNTGKPTRYETKMKRKGNELRNVLVSTSPLLYGDDEYATLGVITDITEQKRAEEELKKHRNHLEELVAERTDELRSINRALETEVTERRLAEEALRESEEKYRTFLRDFKGIAFRGDLNFVPMFIHGAVEEITGYTESEFTAGQPSWDQIIHPDDFSVFIKNGEEIRTVAGYSTEREYRIIRKDGTFRWVLETIQNICGASGEPSYVQGTINDITERKSAEEALLRSEEKYRDLVENINDGISTVNSQGIITYASPVFERFSGFAPNEIVGRHITEFVYDPDTEESIGIFSKILSGAGPMEIELRLKNKYGGAAWRRIAVRRTFDSNGELTLKCVLSDIDDRKRTEEELHIKDIALADSINGITLTDTFGINAVITYVNASCVKMWGYKDADDISGKPVTDFYDNKRDVVKVMIALRDNGNWVGEINALKKDGSAFPLHLSSSLIRDKTGKPLCTISSYTDLTERKRTEERLRKSLIEKDVLLKEVNHRVKNNLNVVASLLSLQARQIENEEAKTALLESKSRIMTMANIHKRLYGVDDLANIDFGDYIRQLATDLISSSTPNLDDARIHFDIDEIKLNVNAAIPCGLLINELLSNSLKHAYPDGQPREISIDIDKDENANFTITMADKGVGIPEDIDYRNTETLGMRLVDALVKQLDATIELDRSEGTRFTIRFSIDNDR